MDFTELALEGAYVVTSERHRDERGSLSRIWDASEFARHGLTPGLAQSSVSRNPRRGTLRGLHYQVAPHEEAKLVLCLRGSIWDVIVDMRRESATFRQWHGHELNSESLQAVYVPEGFAHGFLTLTEDTLVLYQISEVYSPNSARGVRWDDPAFNIHWPDDPALISERDRSYPDVDPTADSGS
jgi:dTDP-4-dehydrorhamnose 3,5-epimerase